MRLTLTKGILPDRVLIVFWIGEKATQSVVMSYTELREILSDEDMKELMSTSLGTWKASYQIKLENVNGRN